MKVSELRERLRTADRDKLEKAFAECYKLLPKAKKEEADPVIIGVLSGEEAKQQARGVAVDFEALKQEVEIFIDNAYANNYFAPNRTVPKSQRPKWRFMVKRYIKEFQNIRVDDPHYPEMVALFTALYKLLCHACNYYVFSTEDPFQSIGWRQPELFQVLVKMVFAEGYERAKIASMVSMATISGVSRENLPILQSFVLCAELKTSDVKYIALEEIKKQVEAQNSQLIKIRKDSIQIYQIQEIINDLCDMLLVLSIELAETEEGLRYYFAHCQEKMREIILYRALRVADWETDDNAIWLAIYRYGLKQKIKPREELKAEYAKRTQSENPLKS